MTWWYWVKLIYRFRRDRMKDGRLQAFRTALRHAGACEALDMIEHAKRGQDVKRQTKSRA